MREKIKKEYLPHLAKSTYSEKERYAKNRHTKWDLWQTKHKGQQKKD